MKRDDGWKHAWPKPGLLKMAATQSNCDIGDVSIFNLRKIELGGLYQTEPSLYEKNDFPSQVFLAFKSATGAVA
ncbi:MAG: hypothetical protein CM15mP85_05310 [Rhodobacterales bacterium]|nr:MAG: hypothetical protein CM15mP85_05310 [Rhodobacterales bacterium]